jgi:hypothetical protein
MCKLVPGSLRMNIAQFSVQADRDWQKERRLAKQKIADQQRGQLLCTVRHDEAN